MTGDPVQEVKNHIKTVGVYLGSKEPTEEARTNALKALELLFDWCESYDMANGKMLCHCHKVEQAMKVVKSLIIVTEYMSIQKNNMYLI